MKTSNIYVGINGATIALSNDKRGVAVYPPQKGGENVSYVLLDSGQMVKVPGARWGKVSVPRYLKENGFELNPNDERTLRLADMLDVEDGRSLVESASKTQAAALQRTFVGQTCTFVPFDEAKPTAAVKIEAPNGSQVISFDLVSGFASAAVKIEYVRESQLGWDLALSSGWLVGPDGDAGSLPRNTEYGGLVEQAVYVICNCGLGTLIGERNLMPNPMSTYPRGLMKFSLENGDFVQVGVDGCDDLVVSYFRAGEIQYMRRGMYTPRLGDVIGAIAAVIVRVGEKDAWMTNKFAKKAA
ncbi:hypothetical protein G3A43_08485 [Paraburkholderia aspalathi]|nr:hypothetical protein [Paraburkholderia aspalathi]MBK3780293.1 hypothetical protein [Paraburkholderia aspalathi]